MTSEVMIMNRQAVVLAADSAVTYGGGPGSVVTLEAEKILQLGPNMALMVYSRGDVLGRSWSHIAHAFKRAQGELDFDSVQACADAFFAFIDNNRQLFPEKEEREELEDLMRAAMLTVLNHARNLRTHAPGQYETDAAAFEGALDLYRAHLLQDEGGAERPSLEVFAALDRDRFYQQYASMLDSLIGEALGEFGMQESIRNKLYDFAYLIITRPAFLEPYAGLVFAGFGEGDVFPVYCHYYASIMVDGVIKRAHDETTQVGVENGPNAYLRTFAQAEMTHAFLRGVHPYMFDVMASMNMVTNEAASEIALRKAGLDEARSVGSWGNARLRTAVPVRRIHPHRAHDFTGRIHRPVHRRGRRFGQKANGRNRQGSGGAQHSQKRPAPDPDRRGRRSRCRNDLAHRRI